MNDVTRQQRYCEICGDPIRRNNSYGICYNNDKPACRQARVRRQKGLPEPVQRYCSVCGYPIRSDNAMGICQRNLECRKIRARKLREEGPMGNAHLREEGPETRHCEICGRRLRRDNASGLCNGMRSPACQAERDRRRRSDSPSAVLEPWIPVPYLRAGTVFGRFTALEDAMAANDFVLCRCECEDGTEKRVRAKDLVNGKSRSCGCLRRELYTTHCFSKHPLYRTWVGIVNRTTNPDDTNYRNYGARGIRISERWLDPVAFIEDIEREIGPRPEGVTEAGYTAYSLDRINVEGHYESGNVQWASWTEQAMNRRKVPVLTEQHDALAAEVARLTAQLQARAEHPPTPRKRKELPPSEEPLF